MRTVARAAFAAATLSVAALTPGVASAGGDIASAEKLRKLDIMLMVSSLRCRFGDDDFQPEYREFSAKHLHKLNAASREMHADLSRRHGHKGAKRKLDKISVGMANRYGLGHPWLGCGELKQVTRDLVQTHQSHELVSAADELLADSPRANSVMLARYTAQK